MKGATQPEKKEHDLQQEIQAKTTASPITMVEWEGQDLRCNA